MASIIFVYFTLVMITSCVTGQLQQEYADGQQPMSLPSQYPWPFISAQLTNAKGNKMFYPVIDSKDRQWARHLNGLSSSTVIWLRMTWMSFKLNMRSLSTSPRRYMRGNKNKGICYAQQANEPCQSSPEDSSTVHINTVMPELKRALPNYQMIHTLDQSMAKHKLVTDLEINFPVHN